MSDFLVRMRAPNGVEKDVPREHVDHFRKLGAVVVGRAPSAPMSEPQTLGTFAHRATRSLNPVELARGVRDIATDPVGTASTMASLPGRLAGEAVEDFKQGNYLRAARKGFTAALPVAGGVGGAVLGIPGGPAGMFAGGAAGYAAGTGVAAGLDEGVDELERGNVATGAGALVDATVQGAIGARVARPGANTSADAMATKLERRAQGQAARVFGPTVGPNRYGWGNEARRVGPEMLRRTTGKSREAVSLEVESMRQRFNDALNGAYDVTPTGTRMKTAPVKQALVEEMRSLAVKDANGKWVPLAGNTERLAALRAAYGELDRLGDTLDAKSIRTLRQSWDKLAEQVWEPKTNAGWDKVREGGKGYAAARDALNTQTMTVYPHLKSQAADASFAIKASDLMRQLEETESARSKVGRSVVASVGGAAVGSGIGGPTGAAIGALVTPVIETLMIERGVPALRITAARKMTQLADELRKRGQTPRALQLAEELRGLVPAAAASRAVGAGALRPPMAAEEQPPQAPTSPISHNQPLSSGDAQLLAGMRGIADAGGPMRPVTSGYRPSSAMSANTGTRRLTEESVPSEPLASNGLMGFVRNFTPLGALGDLGDVGNVSAAQVPAVAGKAAKAVKQIKGGGFEKFTETAARGFQFAPIDDAAKARMKSFETGQPFSFRSMLPAARPKAIVEGILKDGGYSVHPATGQRVIGGQPGPRMVGIFPNGSKETLIVPKDKFSERHVQKFFMQNRARFAKDNRLFIGGWVSDIDGVPHVYLDVSRAVDTSRGAAKIGELQNPGGKIKAGKVASRNNLARDEAGRWPVAQRSFFEPENFDPANNQWGDPSIGNVYEFIQSPEFQSRVTEMAEVGRRAMGGENPEWWNIVNGPMARVYGKENMEALAGFIASTSPQNGPVANLKMASELMRRFIKDEPIRQIHWRAPADAMGKVDDAGNRVVATKGKKKGQYVSEGFAPSAGQRFPNLGTYAPNAELAAAGRGSEVSDDKVNDMFHALMGKLVGVFDRHWAKLAEAPERGIYADAVQNRIAGSMTSGQVELYPVIENRVRDLAKEAGVDISKYSAWAWEGIRKTIRDTGQLFGQKHRASAVPPTTTGFNEIFEHLVKAKAKHLGISVLELEKRLRRGDAELLAALLATPVGAAAWAQWQSASATGEARGPS